MERSRTGCATCRKRKRKCDETKPACRACTARGVECGGYGLEVRWSNAVASRGHLAGAQTPVRPPVVPASSSSSSSSPPAPPQYHPTQVQATQQQHQTTVSDSSPSAHSAFSPGSDGAVSRGSVEDEVEPTFEKFLRLGIRRLYASKADPELALAPMFRELSAHSLALRTVGAAMQTYVEEGVSLRTMEAIEYAIQTLRQELDVRHGALSSSTMCACLLVCSLQLFEATPWTSNLKLLTDLYRLGGDLSNLHPNPEHDIPLRQQLEVLAMMDISFLVIGRTTPSVGLWTRFRKLQESWNGGRLTGDEVVSGLPRSLLDVLARSSERLDTTVEQELWEWSGDPRARLIEVQQWDSIRFGAILRVRRFRQYSHAPEVVGYTSTVPSTEIVLYRLLSCIEALLNGIERPEYFRALKTYATLFALTEASLIVSILQKNVDWTQPLQRLRTSVLNDEGAPRKVAAVLFELLDEAWNQRLDFYDIDRAAQARGVEIAIF